MLIGTILCWVLAGLMGFKAMRASSGGTNYQFTFIDGGLLLRGKEVRPRTAGLIAGALAVAPVIAWIAAVGF